MDSVQLVRAAPQKWSARRSLADFAALAETATLLREHGFGRDVVELLLAQSEMNATVAAYSHMELAADRKRALQYLADRVEALPAGMSVIPLRAA